MAFVTPRRRAVRIAALVLRHGHSVIRGAFERGKAAVAPRSVVFESYDVFASTAAVRSVHSGSTAEERLVR